MSLKINIRDLKENIKDFYKSLILDLKDTRFNLLKLSLPSKIPKRDDKNSICQFEKLSGLKNFEIWKCNSFAKTLNKLFCLHFKNKMQNVLNILKLLGEFWLKI